jgi:hypothetical protein
MRNEVISRWLLRYIVYLKSGVLLAWSIGELIICREIRNTFIKYFSRPF